ncbi:orphan sodium- and chloride-dependent neurotransmitter transporter NTT5-like [Pteronotus mesoamericanus]|uniref:orphan sodium- and chloride-dependent neurotransmitter transporter NTT5-like n=1 Tax=Pteronotus mesoamericanus TaxID=1884717 RepID=UPI0023EC5461|nr:orphan sodium- and chloride-dependent neurotransmitter transporter NTT5-like [Pteronotus parnellii mesoamericanus]
MKSFEEMAEGETSKSTQIFKSPSLRLTAKEMLVSKTQNYLTQTKKTETILIQVAFSIGLGSMWRFPYLCHQNGGGDFILMYFFMLLLFGTPLLYMEMILGQWLRVENIQLWKQLVPWLGGIGYANMLVCVLISLYNSTVISWSFSYLANSFHYPLPWTECPRVKSSNVSGLSCLQTVPHQYFWYHTILNAPGYIEEGVKALVPNLTLDIFLTWLLLFIIMATGLKSSMHILIFLLFLPYVILLCLLIRCLFLEGAITSLRQMVTTELSTWASPELWQQAGGHTLYSLGLGLGTVINISHKVGGNNYVQVASLVALVNLVTSLLTTSIIFIVLGFWATNSGQACVEKGVQKLLSLIDKGVLPQGVRPPPNILLLTPPDYENWIESLPQHLKHQVIHFSPPCSIRAQEGKVMQGPGLAFAAFSQAVSLLPGASFWAILLFLVLIIMGLSTLMKILEGILFPLQNSVFRQYPLLPVGVVCLGGFLGSLVFTSKAGSYIISFLDEHVVPLTLVIIVIFQNVTLAWVYGANRFREEMYGDHGHLLWSFFIFLWRYVTPPGLLSILAICLTNLYLSQPHYYITWNSSLSHEVKQPYMQSSLGVWVAILAILTFLPIPVYPLLQWWNLQDRVVSEAFEKMQLPRKPTVPPSKPSQWGRHHSTKTSSEPQERQSESSLQPSNLPLARGSNLDSLWQFNMPWHWQSESSSRFSLPLISSLTSAFSGRGASPSPSKQASRKPTAVVSSDRGRDAKEANLQKKWFQ